MIRHTILVTGGAGFIGANFVRHAVASDRRVVVLDALTYAGNRANLADLASHPNHVFVEGSIADRALVARLLAEYRPGAIVNRSEEHTSELQSLMRKSYAVFCLKKKTDIVLTMIGLCSNSAYDKQ